MRVHLFVLGTLCSLVLVAAPIGCSSDPTSTATGSGGATAGTGGATGSGGSATGSGGVVGSGGAGSGGDSAGSGGAGVDAPVDQPVAEVAPETPPAMAFDFKCGGLVMMGANLVFPPRHSAPMNVSPPFTWGTGPAGTMSYAITMYDLTAMRPHFAMWDIPATSTGLPASIPHTTMPGAPAPAGMRQTNGGFQGPGGPNVNMYELRLWALKVAQLPNPGTDAAQIRTRLLADLNGPKTLVAESQMIIARGTNGGIGMNPPP